MECKGKHYNWRELPIISEVLPEQYQYKICSYEQDGIDCFTATMRMQISSKEEYLKWKKEFTEKSLTTLRVCSTYPSNNSKKIIYKIRYRCQHHTKPRNKNPNGKGGLHAKNTNCSEFCMTVKIKRVVKYSRSLDRHLPDYPTVINLRFHHNHERSTAQFLRYKDVSEECAEKLRKLFLKGHGPSSAINIYIHDLKMEFGDKYNSIAVDRSIVPDMRYVYRLHTKVLEGSYQSSREKEKCNKISLNLENNVECQENNMDCEENNVKSEEDSIETEANIYKTEFGQCILMIINTNERARTLKNATKNTINERNEHNGLSVLDDALIDDMRTGTLGFALNSLRKLNVECNMKIICTSRVFQVHSCVMVARSPFFYKNVFLEKKFGILGTAQAYKYEFPIHVDLDALESVIAFMYTGIIQSLFQKDFFSVKKILSHFEMFKDLNLFKEQYYSNASQKKNENIQNISNLESSISEPEHQPSIVVIPIFENESNVSEPSVAKKCNLELEIVTKSTKYKEIVNGTLISFIERIEELFNRSQSPIDSMSSKIHRITLMKPDILLLKLFPQKDLTKFFTIVINDAIKLRDINPLKSIENKFFSLEYIQTFVGSVDIDESYYYSNYGNITDSNNLTNNLMEIPQYVRLISMYSFKIPIKNRNKSISMLSDISYMQVIREFLEPSSVPADEDQNEMFIYPISEECIFEITNTLKKRVIHDLISSLVPSLYEDLIIHVKFKELEGQNLLHLIVAVFLSKDCKFCNLEKYNPKDLSALMSPDNPICPRHQNIKKRLPVSESKLDHSSTHNIHSIKKILVSKPKKSKTILKNLSPTIELASSLEEMVVVSGINENTPTVNMMEESAARLKEIIIDENILEQNKSINVKPENSAPEEENISVGSEDHENTLSINVKQKMQTDDNINNLPCPHCSNIMLGSSTLRKHINIVHDGKDRYHCIYCNDVFQCKEIREGHETNHRNRNILNCYIMPKNQLYDIVPIQSNPIDIIANVPLPNPVCSSRNVPIQSNQIGKSSDISVPVPNPIGSNPNVPVQSNSIGNDSNTSILVQANTICNNANISVKSNPSGRNTSVPVQSKPIDRDKCTPVQFNQIINNTTIPVQLNPLRSNSTVSVQSNSLCSNINVPVQSNQIIYEKIESHSPEHNSSKISQYRLKPCSVAVRSLPENIKAETSNKVVHIVGNNIHNYSISSKVDKTRNHKLRKKLRITKELTSPSKVNRKRREIPGKHNSKWKIFKCDICSYSTIAKANLKVHFQLSHKNRQMSNWENSGPECSRPPAQNECPSRQNSPPKIICRSNFFRRLSNAHNSEPEESLEDIQRAKVCQPNSPSEKNNSWSFIRKITPRSHSKY